MEFRLYVQVLISDHYGPSHSNFHLLIYTHSVLLARLLLKSRRNADAYCIAKPEIGTTRTDGWVPLVELLKGDTELALDLVAGIAALNCVVLVAVGCFAGLGWCSWTTSAASGRTGGSANAVRIANPNVSETRSQYTLRND